MNQVSTSSGTLYNTQYTCVYERYIIHNKKMMPVMNLKPFLTHTNLLFLPCRLLLYSVRSVLRKHNGKKKEENKRELFFSVLHGKTIKLKKRRKKKNRNCHTSPTCSFFL